jgi:putative endonuclease
METDLRQQRGKTGEDLACEELRRRGYAILARRFRTRVGELDIIARDGPTLVFVEVKARGSPRCGSGEEAVTWRKRRRMTLMAQEYLLRTRLTRVPCRFDVVAVHLRNGQAPQVHVFRGAFLAGE